MTPQRPVETHGLSKSYGAVTALDDVSLSLRAGEIYGLVGRNGAGKTTLMRLLLGLIRPTRGSARIFGWEAGDRRANACVGSLVESPALYPHLTGRDNLRLLAHYCPAGAAQVDVVLEQVGLGAKAATRFGTYSLGMKQRLGVAAALLGDPPLVILDEPTNGLDPGAMADIRELLRHLRTLGRTVVLSSHLLGEVEQVCDRVGVLHDGRLVVEGTLADIHTAAGAQRTVTVHAEPAAESIALLRRLDGVCSARLVDDRIELTVDVASPADINRTLVAAGVAVSEIRVQQRTLEDIFLGITDDGSARPDYLKHVEELR